ncbi:MAG: DUF932 domain-containing protein [Verrucomicrobiae bacterium]|nr:DUF932 domain-containing protein [Verrucomicrobiae bacterium]
MKLNDLFLHCGAGRVEREDLDKQRTPQPSGRWYPIAHGALVDQVRHGLETAGMRVLNEAHALNAGGAQYFGLMQVRLPGDESNEWGTVVGVRNSHDKRFPAALAMGSQVFVCDNLSFNGEVVLARRHTTHIMRDLPQLTTRAVGRLRNLANDTATRSTRYKQCDLNNAEAHDLVIRALDSGAITTTMVPKVLEQWRAPNHVEFRDRNLWSLYNAFTESFKGSLLKLPCRSEAVHGVLDNVALQANPALSASESALEHGNPASLALVS